MNTKQSFINKIDSQLLRDNPVTWSSRIHMVAFYGVIFSLAMILLCFIVPDDPREPDVIHNWIILISVISLLAFVTWMIYLLRFNVFKRFGKWNNLDTLKTFILYFLITLLIVSWPFIPPIVQSIRADNAYSSNEMINDVNSMNIKICQLEKDSIDKRFSADTLQLKDSVNGTIQKDIYNNNMGTVSNNGNYYYTDTATLHTRMLAADSMKKIRDSVYVFYDCPDFQFIEYYDYHSKEKVKLLRSIDLFRLVLQHPATIDRNAVRKELGQLFVKYSKAHDPETLTANSYYSYSYETPFISRIKDKYDLYYVNSSIGNILGKKYRWDQGTINICCRVAYYISLFLSLLVLIYRHTTRRTFFLSLLAAVVLSILTGLFLAISLRDEGAFYTWVIFYFIGFAIITATIANSRNRNVVSGIALNLLVFLTAFMPLVCTALYYRMLRSRYSYQAISHDYLFRNENLHYLMAEIAGFVLLIVLLAGFYRSAYKKWFALPDQ
jgi:hypothetical protein